MSSINYLEIFNQRSRDLTQKANSDQNEWKHQSFESVVLTSGRLFTLLQTNTVSKFSGLTSFSDVCYRTAKGVAMSSNSSLFYCEGYAVAEAKESNIQFRRHAWVINESGIVNDPTWGTLGCWYYGVPFAAKWVKGIWEHREKDHSNYDRSIFLANHLEDYSILRYGLPSEAIANIRG